MKKELLIYDINSCPTGITMDNVLQLVDEHGIVVYESKPNSHSPQIVKSEKEKFEGLKVVRWENYKLENK